MQSYLDHLATRQSWFQLTTSPLEVIQSHFSLKDSCNKCDSTGSQSLHVCRMSQRNPLNPFVFNEYFFSNVTQTPYNQTTFYFIHFLSNILAFCIGSTLVITLSLLIAFKTPTHLKAYSRMLWMAILVDLFVLVVNFTLQPVSSPPPFRPIMS